MKILWIVNTIFPYPAKQIGIEKNCFGGWLNGLANQIKDNKEIELAIATVYNCKDIKEFYDDNITYYLIPGKLSTKYDKKLEKYWIEVKNRFKPDLVHIHGTEFSHGLAFKNSCPEIRIVTSIQGMVSVYEKVYYANISLSDIIKNITFRDIIRMDNIIQQKKKFKKRGNSEIKLIEKSDAIIGRTTWDYSNTKAIKNDIKYYLANETLRNKFYESEWNIENVEKHSIFTSQASYPIKGLHILLKTLYILKKQYPDVKLYVAGINILENSTIVKKIKRSGYAKYIGKIIQKYDLKEQVIFTGILDEEGIVDRYLKSNVFVLPSAIENSSNSLCEAMILGMPCVASNTGGTMDMLEHDKEGFLYPYTEPAICAEYISTIFENKEIALRFGKNARSRALKRHNIDENKNKTIQIYREMIEDKE